MLVQFGNNWIQKIPRTTPTASSNFGCPHGMADCQIGPGLWPRPILAVLSIFLILPITNLVFSVRTVSYRPSFFPLIYGSTGKNEDP